ncbi:MAG: methylmalonyl Co-A mutase-associated GTPase MeaB [Deltaproteobacteria bacterium]|nr:methylmalonyl Co-A mutase-associated GTPase MeaB [Deltaproteobacteria bacterium]
MDLIEKIKNRDFRTASRLIRDFEDDVSSARDILKDIYPHTGKAHIVGITGMPGAGKSTIIGELIRRYRIDNKRVGALLVDPTSPFSGGAILGDRIRMQRHFEDSNVFIRSLAARGALGGLSRAVGDSIHVLDAMGNDAVIIETVGTGQQEVDIVNYAHTVAVVLVPGMGDDVQVMKAGLLEIADIFVINKADDDSARKLRLSLMSLVDSGSPIRRPVKPLIAAVGNISNNELYNQGLDQLYRHINAHRNYTLENKECLSAMLEKKLFHELDQALKYVITEDIMKSIAEREDCRREIHKLRTRELDPYSIARRLIKIMQHPSGNPNQS